MKKLRILALLLALLVVLAACGDTDTNKRGKGRETQALECLKRFTSATTVEEMAKYTTEMSQEMEQQCEAMLQMGTPAEVVWVKFVETYEGVDVYSVAYLDPNTNQPMSHVGYSGLVWQNGKYLVSMDMVLQEKMTARYVDCECAAGKIYTPKDPCKTCNGTGMASGGNTVQIVPGHGAVQVNPEQEIVVPVAPEESLMEENRIQAIPGYAGTVDGSTIQITPLQPIEGETIEITPVLPEGGQVAIIQPDGSIQMEEPGALGSVVIAPGVIPEAALCPDCNGCAEFLEENCPDCKGLGLIINK